MIEGKLDKKFDLDWSEIVEILGLDCSGDHLRKTSYGIVECAKYYQEKELISEDEALDETLPKKSTIEIKKDGTQISDKLILMSENDCKDVEFLLKAHGYDTYNWELVSARNNIWNVYSKQDGIQTLYSSKVTVKPRGEYVWNEEDILRLFDSLESKGTNKIHIEPKQYEKNGDLLVVPIADFHYGLLADSYTTGNDYNLEIAEKVYYQTLTDVISRVKNRKFEKVLFVVGNDFINFDNLAGTTTRGTPQDNASMWFPTVERATKLIANGIEMLANIAPVDVMFIPSNHDLHTMFGIMQTIKAWFRKEKNITVDASPLQRKYYRFGDNLIPLAHDMKVKNALEIITSEEEGKKDWSSCKHIICMLAHLHQSMVYEKKGYLEILRLPTISGWSRWSNTMGYIQTERKNQSFIINEKLGITDTLNTIIDY